MAYYIIIRGPLGIGKSTISKTLAKELDASYFSIDDALAEQGLDKVDESEGCIPLKNFIQVTEEMLPEIKNDLDSGKIVIIDGNFYHQGQIDHLKEKLPYESFGFTLNASVETCIDRDSKREKPHGEGAARALHNLVKQVDYGISVDNDNKTPEEVVKKIKGILQ